MLQHNKNYSHFALFVTIAFRGEKGKGGNYERT